MARQASSAILVVLRINAQEKAVAQQEADEVYAAPEVQRQFAEVNEHLLPGWSVKDIIIDPPMFRFTCNNACVFKVTYIIPERLLIAGKGFEIAIFNKLLFQKIIDRRDAEIVPAVCFQDGDDNFFEG